MKSTNSNLNFKTFFVTISILYSIIFNIYFMFANPDGTFFNTDEAIYILQLKSWEKSGPSYDIKYHKINTSIADYWEKGFAPKHLYRWQNKKMSSIYSIFYTAITFPFFFISHIKGIYFMQLLCLILIIITLSKIFEKENINPILILIITILSPLNFYAHFIGGQIIALSLFITGFYIINYLKNNKTNLFLGGLLLGLSPSMREEYYFAGISLLFFLIFKYRKKILQKKYIYLVLGTAITILIPLLINYINTNHLFAYRLSPKHILPRIDLIQNKNTSDFDIIYNLMIYLTVISPYVLFFIILSFLFFKKRKILPYGIFAISFLLMALNMLNSQGGINIGARSLMPILPVSIIGIGLIAKNLNKKYKKIFWLIFITIEVFAFKNLFFSAFGLPQYRFYQYNNSQFITKTLKKSKHNNFFIMPVHGEIQNLFYYIDKINVVAYENDKTKKTSFYNLISLMHKKNQNKFTLLIPPFNSEFKTSFPNIKYIPINDSIQVQLLPGTKEELNLYMKSIDGIIINKTKK